MVTGDGLVTGGWIPAVVVASEETVVEGGKTAARAVIGDRCRWWWWWMMDIFDIFDRSTDFASKKVT
jgi:hypothetical protein